MRVLGLVLGVAAFLLNPMLACGPGESEAGAQYQYGAAEMREAIEGTWQVTLTDADGMTHNLIIRMEQGSGETARGPSLSWVRSAHACGTRTLVASAHACTDSSEMPLTISFVSGDASYESVPMSGVFRVDSLIFTGGFLDLMLGDERFAAEIDDQGTVTQTYPNPPAHTEFTLVRVRNQYPDAG